MLQVKWVAVAAAILFSASVLVVADEPTTKPADEHSERGHKLTKPWSELTDLTDDQKTQIIAIHVEGLKEMRAAEQKEHEAIMAVLTDDQKKELTGIEEKMVAKRRAARADKGEGAATTEPSAQ
jgi:Spy/CpxP family protein refolding chaperone